MVSKRQETNRATGAVAAAAETAGAGGPTDGPTELAGVAGPVSPIGLLGADQGVSGASGASGAAAFKGPSHPGDPGASWLSDAPQEEQGFQGTQESSIRFPHRLLIRMTREERRLLGRKAHAAELSLSRFLIQTAMRGKPLPTEAERAQLESLMFLVRRTANTLNRLLANARAMRLIGADQVIEGELKKAGELLLRLASELRRRL